MRSHVDNRAARQDRLIAELETTDSTDRAFRDRLRRRFDALETERADLVTQLQTLEEQLRARPDQDFSLLAALPILEHINITEAPEAIQRKLYDALQLQVHYDRPDQARFRIVLTDDGADALAAAAGATITPIRESRAHANATPPGAPLSESTISTASLQSGLASAMRDNA
jgi:hypothetical protein